MRDYMDRRVNLPKGATSPTWGPPPPCKQALTVLHVDSNPLNGADVLTHLRSFLSFFFIKLSQLVVYLIGSQIYEIKTRVEGGGGCHTRLGVRTPCMHVIIPKI